MRGRTTGYRTLGVEIGGVLRKREVCYDPCTWRENSGWNRGRIGAGDGRYKKNKVTRNERYGKGVDRFKTREWKTKQTKNKILTYPKKGKKKKKSKIYLK